MKHARSCPEIVIKMSW